MTMAVVMTIQQKNETRNAVIDVIARFISLNSFVYLITNVHFCVENLFPPLVFKGVTFFFAPNKSNGLDLAIIRERANKVREMPEAFAPYRYTTLSSKLRSRFDNTVSRCHALQCISLVG